MHMDIFKDVVGLSKQELEALKVQKSKKKERVAGPDMTVGAGKLADMAAGANVSSSLEYHVNDQEPFYDAGSASLSTSVIPKKEQETIASNDQDDSRQAAKLKELILSRVHRADVELSGINSGPTIDGESSADNTILKKLLRLSYLSNNENS